MIKEDVLQYLKDNFYIIQQGDSWIVSNKFIRDIGGISSSNTISINPQPVISKTILKPALATKDIYKQFILDAQVPTLIDTGNSRYYANRYSESGFKAFKKIWEDSKINRNVLLASTKWYYSQTRTARKMIGTYFSEGIWESNYDDFVRAKNLQDTKNSNPLTPDKVFTAPKIVDENASNMEQG